MQAIFRIMLIAGAALLLCSHAAFAARATGADSYYTTGARLFSDGDYVNAEKYFLKALSVDRRHTSSMFMLGETISTDVRRLTEAEGWYKKALKESRGDKNVTPRTLFALGKLYILLGHHEDALDSFRKLVGEYPDYYELARAYNHMGIASYRMDRYDSALSFFKSALKYDPNLMEATFNMKNVQHQLSILNAARYHQRMGNNEAAIEEYNKAIESYPNYVAAWYQLGLLYTETGNYDLAVKHFVRARALNHGFIADKEIPYRLAAAFSGRAQSGDIQTALDTYLELGSYKDSELQAGKLYLGMGELKRAEELLSGVADQKSDRLSSSEASYQLGLLYMEKGDHQKALEQFQRALSVAPEVEKYRHPPVDGFTPAPQPEPGQDEQDEPDDYDGMSEYY